MYLDFQVVRALCKWWTVLTVSAYQQDAQQGTSRDVEKRTCLLLKLERNRVL